MSLAEVHEHNETVLDSLELGDLVAYARGMYNHMAVYTGNEEVVHRTGVDGPMRSGPEHASSVTGKVYDKGTVRKQNFWEVAGDSKAYKNNSMDNIYEHFESAEIVGRAVSQVGDVGYNLLFNNCEHFATGCRYGVDVSCQADTLTAGLLFAAAGVGVGVGAGLYYWNYLREKKEKQRQEQN